MAENGFFRTQAHCDDFWRLIRGFALRFFVFRGLHKFLCLNAKRKSRRRSFRILDLPATRAASSFHAAASYRRQSSWPRSEQPTALLRSDFVRPGNLGIRRVQALPARVRRRASVRPGRGNQQATQGHPSPVRHLQGTCCRETEFCNDHTESPGCVFLCGFPTGMCSNLPGMNRRASYRILDGKLRRWTFVPLDRPHKR